MSTNKINYVSTINRKLLSKPLNIMLEAILETRHMDLESTTFSIHICYWEFDGCVISFWSMFT